MRKISRLIHFFIDSPKRSFILCCIFVFFALVFDGSLFHLWRLHRDQKALNERIIQAQVATEVLHLEVKKARNPKYVEKQARERFDLVAEDELVFVFSKEDENQHN